MNHARERGSLRAPVLLLVAATAGVAIVSELLVGTVTAAARDLGMTDLFVGVVIVALVGNAAEHYSAVVLAARRPDGCCAGDCRGIVDPDRALRRARAGVSELRRSRHSRWTCCLPCSSSSPSASSVLSIAFISHDGETHWMEGVQLLAVYVILVLGFYYLPALAQVR